MIGDAARRLLLRQELARDWAAIAAHRVAAASMDPADGPAQSAYVALSLDHAYQGFEAMLMRIERSLELPARTGEHWHRAVLADAAMAIEGLRPAIVPREVEADWRELLRFRHFLRHAYDVALDAEELRRLSSRLGHAVAATDVTVQALLAALA